MAQSTMIKAANARKMIPPVAPPKLFAKSEVANAFWFCVLVGVLRALAGEDVDGIKVGYAE